MCEVWHAKYLGDEFTFIMVAWWSLFGLFNTSAFMRVTWELISVLQEAPVSHSLNAFLTPQLRQERCTSFLRVNNGSYDLYSKRSDFFITSVRWESLVGHGTEFMPGKSCLETNTLKQHRNVLWAVHADRFIYHWCKLVSVLSVSFEGNLEDPKII
jgi:hypothetical protein